MIKKVTIYIFILFLGIIPNVYGEVRPDASTRARWQSLETRYTTIEYQSRKDLGAFDQNIKPLLKGWPSSLLSLQSGTDITKPRIIEKVDALFERVQEILGMREKMGRVVIKIYPDKDQLDTAYESVTGLSLRCYGDTCSLPGTLPRAWYTYDTNTSHVNVRDIHQGILAHEMAHAIIDHYLGILPSKDQAEKMARDVERSIPFRFGLESTDNSLIPVKPGLQDPIWRTIGIMSNY